MIVDPDFMDHWRTGMVADAIGDPMAAIYILRLWAHCQERKADRFTMPTRGLKAQCKAPVDAEAFESALIEAGFVERNGAELIVCGWAEKNASLIAAWSNGNKGGRPKKEPKENPRETQEEPSANQYETQAKPIREEKRREEEKEQYTPPDLAVGTPPGGESQAAKPAKPSRPEDVCPEAWDGWIAHRKRKKGEVTQRVIDSLRKAGAEAGMTLEQAMDWSVQQGHQGFYPPKAGQATATETTYQRSMRERAAQACPGIEAKPLAAPVSRVIRADVIDASQFDFQPKLLRRQ